MSLELTVNENMKKAMLAKDQVSLRGLRAVKSAIQLARTAEGGGSELTEAQELQILQKLVKTRKEAQTVFYRIHSEEAVALIGLLHKLYCEKK